ncbi:MAG: Global nitrogen regulator [Chloroflexi bacterium]|nr:Global nitrogen regulator [Chloroflexota bacterium]
MEVMKLSSSERAIIQGVSLFEGLREEELSRVIEVAHIHSVEDGAYFFMEGNPAEKAYALLTGRVKLTQVTADGQQVILGYLNAGREFGILSMIEGEDYLVSAQAVEACRAMYWDQPSLEYLAARYSRIYMSALQILVRQVREFQNRVRELSTQRVERRIARTVLRLARQSGRKTEQGVLIDLPLSRQDIAEMTGTTLYTVSRILSEWEKDGLVQSERQRVVITYPHGLVSLAEDIPVGDVGVGEIDLSRG